MSNTAIILVASFLLGFGTYAIRASFKTHLLTRELVKAKKPLNTDPVITIKLMAALVIAVIFEKFVIQATEVVPKIYTLVALPASVMLVGIVIMSIVTRRQEPTEAKVNRMLFLETGLLLILSYQILSPVLLTIYHFISIIA